VPDDVPDPAAVAADIDAARDRMIGFVGGCRDVIDALNAQHAREAVAVSQAEATRHLRRSGAAISALVAGLSPADIHRTEIEAALRPP